MIKLLPVSPWRQVTPKWYHFGVKSFKFAVHDVQEVAVDYAEGYVFGAVQ